jgi:hypothetical protein
VNITIQLFIDFLLNDSRRGWCNGPERMDVRHHIVAPLLLLFRCNGKLLRRQMLDGKSDSGQLTRPNIAPDFPASVGWRRRE